MPHGISITWCGAPARTAELADFFARHVGPDYISHAELQGGRALSPSQWRPNLRDVLCADIEPRLAAGRPGPASKPIAMVEEGGALVALAYVTFAGAAPVRFAIEDLIVSPAMRPRRRQGTARLDRSRGEGARYSPAVPRKRSRQRTRARLLRARRLSPDLGRDDEGTGLSF